MPTDAVRPSRPRLAVFASGQGTTFAALVDAARCGSLPAEVVLLIVSRSDVEAIALAEQLGVEHAVLDERALGTERADQLTLELLRQHEVDLVVLAGYLRKIGPQTLAQFSGRMLNTHPAPLPRFGGKGMYGEHVHRAVLEAGVTESAASVHLVDAEYDTGPVVANAAVPVEPDDTVASLQSRVQATERRLLIAAVTELAAATPSNDRIAAVIFDLDDTLLDHTGAARKGVEGWLARLDVEPTSNLIDHWFEAMERHYASYIRGEITFDEQRRARLRDMLAVLDQPVGSEDELDQLFEAYLALYSAAWRPFGDVAAALALVEARGLQVAVVTNGTQQQQLQKLAAMGISERVGPVLCSDVLGFGKPDARIFHAACAALGVQPQAALNVGDDYELDVIGARAAGLQAVHLDRPGTSTFEEAARISSLRELGQFL